MSIIEGTVDLTKDLDRRLTPFSRPGQGSPAGMARCHRARSRLALRTSR
ncbi:hypothetical protein Q1M64_06235 (plasmid) [Sinorhizobium meliloti]|nr:hypothetical protein Q1M64_06235 [Sinorhizobium meliloti]